MAKFIFVTGGVVSGLGKGITAASLGRLLKCRGLKVASQKLDPVYEHCLHSVCSYIVSLCSYNNINPGGFSLILPVAC